MKKRTFLKKFAYALAGLGILVVLYRVLAAPEPLVVEVIPVRRGDLVVEVSDTGQTHFSEVNTVLSPQTGWVTQNHVRTGDQVSQNKSPLATLSAAQAPLIDTRTRASLKAQAEAAQAQEQQAKAQLTRIRGNLQASQRALQRAESVLVGGGVSLQEVESLRARTAELKAELRAAEALIDALRHSVEAAQWSYQSSATNTPAESLILKAPLSGVVSWVYHDKPRFVAVGEPLFDIARPGDLFFEVELLVRDSLGVKIGQNVRFTETSLPGKVRSISPTAHPKISPLGISEQRVRIQIDFGRAVPSEWPAGLELEAHIEVQRSDNTLVVPLSAVWTENEQSYIFVVHKNKMMRRVVRTGIHSYQEQEILSGLDGTEKIIRFPSSSMGEGLSVSTRI